MQGRQERVLIPSTIAFFSMMITLWAAAGFNYSPFTWLPFMHPPTDQWFKLIFTVGIANLGIGFFCQAIVVYVFFQRHKIRFGDDGENLSEAFGIAHTDYSNKNIQKELREVLLAEFHARLHSHAPQSFIDFCSRRNSAWYIAFNSAVATILGWLFAMVVVILNHVGFYSSLCGYLCPVQRNCLLFVSLFLFGFAWILRMQGKKWNQEFWDASSKWIHWDLQTHKLIDGNWWRNEVDRRKAISLKRHWLHRMQ